MPNIYVVGHETDMHPFVKVGMTNRCVTKRTGDWDSGSPWDWVYHLDLQIPNEHTDKLRAVEQGTHAKLHAEGLRVRAGHEWFDADSKTVTLAIANTLAEVGIDAEECTLHRATDYWALRWDQAKRACVDTPLDPLYDSPSETGD